MVKADDCVSVVYAILLYTPIDMAFFYIKKWWNIGTLWIIISEIKQTTLLYYLGIIFTVLRWATVHIHMWHAARAKSSSKRFNLKTSYTYPKSPAERERYTNKYFHVKNMSWMHSYFLKRDRSGWWLGWSDFQTITGALKIYFFLSLWTVYFVFLINTTY